MLPDSAGSAATAGGGADINAVHFANADEGIAVCDGDLIIKTVDGGEHWTACTGNTGTANVVLSAVCFTRNHFLVGTTLDATGSLWASFDGGDTWVRQRFTGDNAEDVTSLSFYGSHFGYMVTNTAGPVGSIHRSIDGGHTWQELDPPTNSGFNAILACGYNDAKLVGKVNAATAFIGSVG